VPAQPYDQSAVEAWLGQDLDEWVRRIIRRTFDPNTGAQFWLKRATELDFDPLEIETAADLVRFGPFPIDELRTYDPASLIPSVCPRTLSGRVWETGGTTGKPCRVFLTESTIVERGIWKRYALAGCVRRPVRRWLPAGYGSSSRAGASRIQPSPTPCRCSGEKAGRDPRRSPCR
jgi:phenylacetate-coenzyme A ligase PaaK-like adenylate-forming protein